MRRRSVLAMILVLGISVTAVSLAAAAGKLEALNFLLGEWGATGSGSPGEASGTATFAPSLQGQVILRSSYADYPATATAPALRHEDLMVIYSPAEGTFRADYYDNEGHIIRYAVSVPEPGRAVFLSDAVSGAPRFRLTYKLEPDGLLRGEFEIAPPARPEAFSRYLAWESRRAEGK
ncbi:MAG: hypothetical protein WCB96_06130 [Candidatus Aminicenantales bacterium]